MEFYDLIRKRESVRSYDPDREVDRGILEKILEAGRLAPSAANNQPWRFLMISSPEMLNKVRKCYQREWFHDAPHVLVVAGNKNDAWVREQDGYNAVETDLTIALDYMILAATNEGLGTCWIAAFDPQCLHSALGLNADEVVYTITPIGYPRSDYKTGREKQRKSFDDVAEII